MAEAASIFVSHAHEDNDWCRACVRELHAAGADVWYDEHNLGYGAIGDEIERQLRARPIFIVILSTASVTKPWVRREMEAAITLRDRNPERIIVPVVAEKVEIPIFWENFKRVSGPGDAALSAGEAARKILHMLAIAPSDAPAEPPPASVPETARQAWIRGMQLLAAGRHPEALAASERATTLEPLNADYWNSKGDALLALKRYEEALAAYNLAVEFGVKRGEEYLYDIAVPWNHIISILQQLGRYAEAAQAERQRNAIVRKHKWQKRFAALRAAAATAHR